MGVWPFRATAHLREGARPRAPRTGLHRRNSERAIWSVVGFGNDPAAAGPGDAIPPRAIAPLPTQRSEEWPDGQSERRLRLRDSASP